MNMGSRVPSGMRLERPVQILLFCVVAIELKRRAPFAHTFLEVIRARYDRAGHIVFIVFCLCTNILVTSMLLTGGSAVVQSLSGMHVAAACFLLPVGTIVYTMVGGIKATFLTDYAHTVAVLIIILYFTFVTYATSPLLGSPSKVYDLLVNASRLYPVEGNAQGSYLTMRCTSGVTFFVINIIGNFGTVFLDNGYYSKAHCRITGCCSARLHSGWDFMVCYPVSHCHYDGTRCCGTRK